MYVYATWCYRAHKETTENIRFTRLQIDHVTTGGDRMKDLFHRNDLGLTV